MAEESLPDEDSSQARLDRALEQYLPALTGGVDAADLPDARAAYTRAFELLIDRHSEDPDALEQALRQSAQAALAGGPGSAREIVRDYRLLKELGAMSGRLSTLALSTYRMQVELTPELRTTVESFCARLLQISAEIRAERPYLLETAGPQPVFRLTSARYVSGTISESLLDGDYVLGKSRNRVSLRLGQVIRMDRLEALQRQR